MWEVESGAGIGNEVCGLATAQEYVLSAIPGIALAVMKIMDVSERRREQPGGALRVVIDMLLAVDIKCAPLNDDAFRKRHNAVVLRYITEKPMADKEICKRLKIQTWTLED